MLKSNSSIRTCPCFDVDIAFRKAYCLFGIEEISSIVYFDGEGARSMPTSVILATIIGVILRSMMRSENETISNLGTNIMKAIFIFGIAILIYYKLNNIPLY